MNIEKLLFKKENQPAEPQNESSEEIDVTRRRLLQGGAALAAATALGVTEAAAHHPAETLNVYTRTERLNNAEAVKEWLGRLEKGRDVLNNPKSTYPQIMDVIRPDCLLDRQVFKETDFDHEKFIREELTKESWPALQLRTVTPKGGEPEEHVRWAHEPNTEINGKLTAGNASFIDNVMISADHVTRRRYAAETLGNNFEISGIGLTEFSANKSAVESVKRSAFESDRTNASNDLHAQLGYILSIHERRGAGASDNTDLTPIGFIKMNKDLIKILGIDTDVVRKTGPGPEDVETVSMLEALANSYMGIVAPRDSNLDHVSDSADLSGLSGSPVITDAHCVSKEKTQDGVVLIANKLNDAKRKRSYDVVFVHGPDVIVEMQDTVNTILSEDLDGEAVPAKKNLTEKVQQVLFDYGYKEMKTDGDYGDYTRRVVEDFQKRVFPAEVLEKAVIPGVVDRLTWGKLFPKLAGVNKNELYEAMK